MTLPPLLQRYRSRIERGLREGLQGETRVAEMLRYHLGIENGDDDGAASMGKLLRPSLVLFTAEQLGEAPDHALPAAIGLELIHNFSLIHDDIQDHDETRRGRPTVWCRYGVAQAINAGDAMQVLAVRHALDAGEAAAGILLEATWEMIEGQSLDLALEGRPASADAYLSMIDRKTGALLRCALRLGGTLAGAEPEVLLALAAAGTELGRAFQIHDDLLGIWGNGATTGKPQGSDIRRRKRTLPIAVAFARADDDRRRLLDRIYAAPEIPEADVDWIIDLMDRLEVRGAVERMVSEHLDRAGNELSRVPFSASGRDEMDGLIAYLARRDR